MLTIADEARLSDAGFIPANHKRPAWYPVAIEPVYRRTGDVIDGQRAVVRTDTGKVLAIHGDRYKLVPNELLYGAFDQALENSGLDLTDMYIGQDMAMEGARAFRQYVLPAYQVNVGKAKTALRIVLFNSYDGSTRIKARTGAYNFVCANTSIVGDDWENLSIAHTGQIDVDAIAGTVVGAMRAGITEMQQMSTWRDRRCDDRDALAVCRAVPGVSKGVTDHLVHSFIDMKLQEDHENGGPNVWALYNTLTSWSTHGVDGDNAAAQRADREHRVWKTTQTPAFRQLVEA